MGTNNEGDGISQRHWQMWHNITTGKAWLDVAGDRFFYSDPNGQNELSEADMDIITTIDDFWWKYKLEHAEDAKIIEEGLSQND